MIAQFLGEFFSVEIQASGTGANLISGTGSITGLTAGNTNASSMTVNVNTNAAAAINGAIGLNFFTAGAVNGVSNGLGELGVGSADFGVVGTIQTAGQVVDQAKPVINTPSINLGSVRINTTSPTQFASVTNQATGNPQAALNASISAVAPITASGSFTLLAPGGTNNDTLQVGMSTATAGAINSTATVAFVSDASNIGGCGSNCQMNLPSQDVNVTGNIYRLATGSVASPVDIGAARVGNGTLAGNLSVTNTAANDGFSEKLNASITGTTPAVIGASGQVLGLAAGQTNSSSLQVTLDNSTAGAISGTAMVQFKSDGTGFDNGAPIDNGSQVVTVTGKVYTPAVANVFTSSPVDFGIVHVGDGGGNVAKSVAVQNSATTTALNDVLIGSIGAGGAPFSGNGDLGAGLGPQASSSALQVNLDTTKAGIYTGSANLSLASHDADLSDLSLTTNPLALMAQVNLYAALAFLQQGGQGSLTGGGNSFVLDFGNVLQNSSQEALLAFLNDNPLADQAFTDLLSSTGTIISGSGFTITGDSVSDLLGGVSQGGFHVAFDASDLGSFLETLSFDVKSSNPSGFNGFLAPVTFTIEGDVVASGPSVPGPGTLTLLGTCLILIGVIGWRRRLHRR